MNTKAKQFGYKGLKASYLLGHLIQEASVTLASKLDQSKSKEEIKIEFETKALELENKYLNMHTETTQTV